MRLNNYGHRHDLLIDWILQEVSSRSQVLDVGANDGSFCPQVARLAPEVGLLAGVDPDVRKLQRNPYLTERFAGTLEQANIPSERFDFAFAIYVFEHVADERMFMQAAARVLRPGGSFFFITPNAQHYFAHLSWLLARTGLQERALRLLRPDQLVDRYHYPALYRLNHPRQIESLGKAFGFRAFEYRYSEAIEEVACYFPGPTKVLPRLWERMVEITGKDHLLCNLMGRMVKGSR